MRALAPVRARPGSPWLVLVALATVVAPAARADERVVQVFSADADAEKLDAVCASASPECDALVERISGRVVAGLMILAKWNEPEVYPLARLAADSASAAIRVAAADALGSLVATAEDVPILAELADDPVPAVRIAALGALARSNDERGRRIAERADVLGGATPGESIDPEAPESPPAAAEMIVAMPPDALFLHFASNRSVGRYVWITDEPRAKVLERYRGVGKAALTPAAYRELVEGEQAAAEARENAQAEEQEASGMPSEEAMEEAMAMAEKMMAALEEASGKSPEEQAEVMQRAARPQRRPQLDPNLADGYERAELFGDPRLVIVPAEGPLEAIVAIYADLLLGRTGIAVHRSPLEEE